MRIERNHFTRALSLKITLPECDFFLHRQHNSNSINATMTSITMIPPALAPAINPVDAPSLPTSEDKKDLK